MNIFLTIYMVTSLLMFFSFILFFYLTKQTEILEYMWKRVTFYELGKLWKSYKNDKKLKSKK